MYTGWLHGIRLFNLGETMMEDILAFVVQWGDTIVEILNRIIAAIGAFIKEAPTPK
jgi:hypothetical protein